MRKKGKSLDYLILEELKRKEGYVSGEELANKLKISRQALWKHIGKLVDKEYEIVAVPHLGYKLLSSPDKFQDCLILRLAHLTGSHLMSDPSRSFPMR